MKFLEWIPSPITILSLIIAVSFATAVNGDNIAGEKSTFKITFPTELQSKKDYEHAEALFGRPHYGTGRKILGELLYMTYEDLHTGCETYPYRPPKDGENFIFLIDRGDCSFVQKVRLAQSKGATAIVIADNVCQCKNYNLPIETKGRTQKLKELCEEKGKQAALTGRLDDGIVCESMLPFMADDGTGGDIIIPSYLIDFHDAQKFKDCYLTANPQLIGGEKAYESITGYTCDKGTKIIASMEWTLPAPDNNVEFDLWTSSDSEAKFKKDFAAIAFEMRASTTFTPHYFVWKGASWGCEAAGEPCKSQCTKGGVYCNPDPDHDLDEGVAGVDVIQENLRQLCVWQQAKKDLRADAGKLWWDYTIEFAKRCHPGSVPTEDLFNEKCSKEVHDSIKGLDWKKTEKCVKDSWDKNDLKKNSLLDAEISARTAKNILQLPTLVVNEVIVRGGVTAASALNAICAGFEAETEPALCDCANRVSPSKLAECVSNLCPSDSKFCDRDSHCYSTSEFNIRCNNACPIGNVYCGSQQTCLKSLDKCFNCTDPALPFYCSARGICTDTLDGCNVGGGVSAGTVFVIMLFVLVVFAVAALMYWRRQKRKIREEVRGILSEYMPLDELENRLGSGTSNGISHGIATSRRPILVPTTTSDESATELPRYENETENETGAGLI